MSYFNVSYSSAFDRDAKKLRKKDKKIIEVIEMASKILQEDPFNAKQIKNIKKLVDVEKGCGQWRIRFGDYRIRYDIAGKDVVLHSIKNRKDIYK